MTSDELLATLRAAAPEIELTAGTAADQLTVFVARDRLVEFCRAVKTHPDLRFTFCADVTAVDRLPAEPRFEVVYHLASLDHRRRLRVKVAVPGGDPRMPTVTTVWKSANWCEREVFDLFGIVFDGHPNLARILMPEDWQGHPLRKDYPVQIDQPVKTSEALELDRDQFHGRPGEGGTL